MIKKKLVSAKVCSKVREINDLTDDRIEVTRSILKDLETIENDYHNKLKSIASTKKSLDEAYDAKLQSMAEILNARGVTSEELSIAYIMNVVDGMNAESKQSMKIKVVPHKQHYKHEDANCNHMCKDCNIKNK